MMAGYYTISALCLRVDGDGTVAVEVVAPDGHGRLVSLPVAGMAEDAQQRLCDHLGVSELSIPEVSPLDETIDALVLNALMGDG